MIVVASVEAVALIAIVFMFLRHARAQLDQAQETDRATVAERRELLERIQRPERVPVVEPIAFVVPDIEPDELELIGTIADPKENE